MEKKKIPPLLKAVLSVFALVALLLLVLLARSYFVTPQKLGPPPDGWVAVDGSTNIERIKFRPCETRTIRCDAVNLAVRVRADCFVVYAKDTDTAELKDQTFDLKPRIFADATNEKPMWALLHERAVSDRSLAYWDMEIHVHSDRVSTDISTPGWEGTVEKHQVATSASTRLEH